MKSVLIALGFVLLVPSCQTLSPLPEDTGQSDHWLEVSRGEFWCGSRIVVTDNQVISEYYERVNSGRLRGNHILKEQEKIVVLPEVAKSFWQDVEGMNILSWSNDDMPPDTGNPTLAYRSGKRKIRLLPPRSAKATGSRFKVLEEKIHDLQKQPASP